MNPDYSEQDLVSCAGCGGCSGAYMNCPLDWLLYHGTVSESCFPYVAWDAPCNPNCNPHYKISGWRSITPNTEQAIKVALTRGPIIGTFAVYEDYRYYGGGVYEYTSGALLGYHAVTIVGWGADSRGTFWICKNSWGNPGVIPVILRYVPGIVGLMTNYMNCMLKSQYLLLILQRIPINGIRPLTVQFTDLSSPPPTSWDWSFGDGTPTSTLQSPTHTYSSPGNYAVTLSANSYVDATQSRRPTTSLSSRHRRSSTAGRTGNSILSQGQPPVTLPITRSRFKALQHHRHRSGENVYLGSNVKPDFSDIRFTTIDDTFLTTGFSQ